MLNLTPLQIIGIVLVINGALVGSSAQLTDLFGPLAVKYIVSIASIGNTVLGGIVSFLSGQGSQIRNVLAMPGVEKITVNSAASPTLATIAVDPLQDKIAPTTAAMDKVTATAAKAIVILAILIGGMFAFASDASAQGIKVKLPLDPLKLNQASTPTPAARPATASDGLAKIMDSLSAVEQKVVDGVVADITAADADASQLSNPADPTSLKDPISHACYPAAIKFLQSLPVATAPTGEFILVQLFQKKRDFIAQIRAGLPVYLKLGCAPLLGDEAAIFTKLIGLVGVKVGLDALAPGLGLAMPVL